LDEFLTMLVGPDWQRESERDLPGSVVAMERAAATFFESDLQAVISWEFGSEDAARIICPVLYVGGSNSGLWFTKVRGSMLQLLPHAQDTTVQGAGHLLALTHPLRGQSWSWTSCAVIHGSIRHEHRLGARYAVPRTWRGGFTMA